MAPDSDSEHEGFLPFHLESSFFLLVYELVCGPAQAYSVLFLFLATTPTEEQLYNVSSLSFYSHRKVLFSLFSLPSDPLLCVHPHREEESADPRWIGTSFGIGSWKRASDVAVKTCLLFFICISFGKMRCCLASRPSLRPAWATNSSRDPSHIAHIPPIPVCMMGSRPCVSVDPEDTRCTCAIGTEARMHTRGSLYTCMLACWYGLWVLGS